MKHTDRKNNPSGQKSREGIGGPKSWTFVGSFSNAESSPGTTFKDVGQHVHQDVAYVKKVMKPLIICWMNVQQLLGFGTEEAVCSKLTTDTPADLI